MRPYGEFPISFDIYRNGKLYQQYNAKDNEEEKAILAAVSTEYHTNLVTAQKNRIDRRFETRKLHTIKEIQDLKLCTVYCYTHNAFETVLLSLALEVVIFGNEEETAIPFIPHAILSQEQTDQAFKEWFGDDPEIRKEDFVGWPAIIHYLKNHPDLCIPHIPYVYTYSEE